MCIERRAACWVCDRRVEGLEETAGASYSDTLWLTSRWSGSCSFRQKIPSGAVLPAENLLIRPRASIPPAFRVNSWVVLISLREVNVAALLHGTWSSMDEIGKVGVFTRHAGALSTRRHTMSDVSPRMLHWNVYFTLQCGHTTTQIITCHLVWLWTATFFFLL